MKFYRLLVDVKAFGISRDGKVYIKTIFQDGSSATLPVWSCDTQIPAREKNTKIYSKDVGMRLFMALIAAAMMGLWLKGSSICFPVMILVFIVFLFVTRK